MLNASVCYSHIMQSGCRRLLRVFNGQESMLHGDATDTKTMEHHSRRKYIRILLIAFQIYIFSHIFLLQLHIHIPKESQEGSRSNSFILLFIIWFIQYFNRFEQRQGFLCLIHVNGTTCLHDAIFHSLFTIRTSLVQRNTLVNRGNIGSRAALRIVLLQSIVTSFHRDFCYKPPQQGS